jgi:hypothetical protein
MAKKNTDPLSEKARALNDEIAALEAEIKKLDSKLAQSSTPKFRSTALPKGKTVPHATEKPAPPPPSEPVFEEIPVKPMQNREDADSSDHYNELGVRKYDLPALWSRIRNHLSGPTTSNPRLVNYLAAGGVQGLKPLRYEKRVARNRVILLSAVLLAVLLGILLLVLRPR